MPVLWRGLRGELGRLPEEEYQPVDVAGLQERGVLDALGRLVPPPPLREASLPPAEEPLRAGPASVEQMEAPLTFPEDPLGRLDLLASSPSAALAQGLRADPRLGQLGAGLEMLLPAAAGGLAMAAAKGKKAPQVDMAKKMRAEAARQAAKNVAARQAAPPPPAPPPPAPFVVPEGKPVVTAPQAPPQIPSPTPWPREAARRLRDQGGFTVFLRHAGPAGSEVRGSFLEGGKVPADESAYVVAEHPSAEERHSFLPGASGDNASIIGRYARRQDIRPGGAVGGWRPEPDEMILDRPTVLRGQAGGNVRGLAQARGREAHQQAIFDLKRAADVPVEYGPSYWEVAAKQMERERNGPPPEEVAQKRALVAAELRVQRALEPGPALMNEAAVKDFRLEPVEDKTEGQQSITPTEPEKPARGQLRLYRHYSQPEPGWPAPPYHPPNRALVHGSDMDPWRQHAYRKPRHPETLALEEAREVEAQREAIRDQFTREKHEMAKFLGRRVDPGPFSLTPPSTQGAAPQEVPPTAPETGTDSETPYLYQGGIPTSDYQALKQRALKQQWARQDKPRHEETYAAERQQRREDLREDLRRRLEEGVNWKRWRYPHSQLRLEPDLPSELQEPYPEPTAVSVEWEHPEHQAWLYEQPGVPARKRAAVTRAFDWGGLKPRHPETLVPEKRQAVLEGLLEAKQAGRIVSLPTEASPLPRFEDHQLWLGDTPTSAGWADLDLVSKPPHPESMAAGKALAGKYQAMGSEGTPLGQPFTSPAAAGEAARARIRVADRRGHILHPQQLGFGELGMTGMEPMDLPRDWERIGQWGTGDAEGELTRMPPLARARLGSKAGPTVVEASAAISAAKRQLGADPSKVEAFDPEIGKWRTYEKGLALARRLHPSQFGPATEEDSPSEKRRLDTYLADQTKLARIRAEAKAAAEQAIRTQNPKDVTPNALLTGNETINNQLQKILEKDTQYAKSAVEHMKTMRRAGVFGLAMQGRDGSTTAWPFSNVAADNPDYTKAVTKHLRSLGIDVQSPRATHPGGMTRDKFGIRAADDPNDILGYIMADGTFLSRNEVTRLGIVRGRDIGDTQVGFAEHFQGGVALTPSQVEKWKQHTKEMAENRLRDAEAERERVKGMTGAQLEVLQQQRMRQEGLGEDPELREALRKEMEKKVVPEVKQKKKKKPAKKKLAWQGLGSALGWEEAAA